MTFKKAMNTGKSISTPTLDGFGSMQLILSRHESMKALLGELLQAVVRGICDRGGFLDGP